MALYNYPSLIAEADSLSNARAKYKQYKSAAEREQAQRGPVASLGTGERIRRPGASIYDQMGGEPVFLPEINRYEETQFHDFMDRGDDGEGQGKMFLPDKPRHFYNLHNLDAAEGEQLGDIDPGFARSVPDHGGRGLLGDSEDAKAARAYFGYSASPSNKKQSYPSSGPPMQSYPSAPSYDSPSNFIGLGPVELGAAQRQRLNRQYDGLMSQVGQQAVSSGLYNTTVPMTQRQAVERARGQALTGLEGQLMDEQMDAYRGMTGDALLSELQSRLARTSEIDSATAQGIVDNVANVLDQIAFLEAKNEKGPNLDKLREIVSLLGQSMAESGDDLGGIFTTTTNRKDDDDENGFRDTPGVGQNPFQPDYETIAGVLDSVAAGNANVREGDIKGDLGLRPSKPAGTGSGKSGSGGSGTGTSTDGPAGLAVGLGGGGGGGGISGGGGYPSASGMGGRMKSFADRGLRYERNSLNNFVAIPPDSKDFETDEAYRDAVDAYNEFNKLFPMASSEDITETAKKLGIGDIGKFLPEDFEEGAGTVKKRKKTPWEKFGMNYEEYLSFMHDDEDTD